MFLLDRVRVWIRIRIKKYGSEKLNQETIFTFHGELLEGAGFLPLLNHPQAGIHQTGRVVQCAQMRSCTQTLKQYSTKQLIHCTQSKSSGTKFLLIF